jgi:hypothetical protein
MSREAPIGSTMRLDVSQAGLVPHGCPEIGVDSADAANVGSLSRRRAGSAAPRGEGPRQRDLDRSVATNTIFGGWGFSEDAPLAFQEPLSRPATPSGDAQATQNFLGPYSASQHGVCWCGHAWESHGDLGCEVAWGCPCLGFADRGEA